MTLQIVGKHIETGSSIRERISERFERVMAKYFDGGHKAFVTVEKVRNGFEVDCLIQLDTGLSIHASGEGDDAYVAFEKSAERIEKQLRRYNRRLKNHHARASSLPADDFVISSDVAEETSPGDDNPVVIAESNASISSMSVADAVMALDLGPTPFVLFRHSATDRINLVYHRPDGNVGWLDPKV
ncbi:MAG: ribosome-associated translation inhibitor RaiA [Pseudomonadota bacterium]